MHTVTWMTAEQWAKRDAKGNTQTMSEAHPSHIAAEKRVMELDGINEQSPGYIPYLEWTGHDGKIIQCWDL